MAQTKDIPQYTADDGLPAKKALTKAPTQASLKAAFATATHHANEMRGHSVYAVAHRLAIGVELQRLHETHGIQRGGDRKSADQTVTRDGLISWPALVHTHCGFSEPTARRIMALTEGFAEFNAAFAKLLKTKASPDKILDFLCSKTEGMTNGELKEILDSLKPEPPPQLENGLPEGKGLGGKTTPAPAETEAEIRAKYAEELAEIMATLRVKKETDFFKRIPNELLAAARAEITELGKALDAEISTRKA